MYKKILEAELEAPHFMSDAALDLCQRLLIRDPALRLGAGASGVDEMKGHPFFRGIDWTALEMKLVRFIRLAVAVAVRHFYGVSCILRLLTAQWAFLCDAVLWEQLLRLHCRNRCKVMHGTLSVRHRCLRVFRSPASASSCEFRHWIHASTGSVVSGDAAVDPCRR